MENTKQMKISLLRDQVDIPKIGASKVLVEVVDGEEVLKSGIIIPGAAQENSCPASLPSRSKNTLIFSPGTTICLTALARSLMFKTSMP